MCILQSNVHVRTCKRLAAIEYRRVESRHVALTIDDDARYEVWIAVDNNVARMMKMDYTLRS